MLEPASRHRGNDGGVRDALGLDHGERPLWLGEGSMMTAPPASSVPRMPGQASGKLCPAGSVTRYLVRESTPDTAALARAL